MGGDRGGGLLPGESGNMSFLGFTLGLWGWQSPWGEKRSHLPGRGPPGAYHQLQRLVEESIAFAVQVGIGAACFGHPDPGKASLLQSAEREKE